MNLNNEDCCSQVSNSKTLVLNRSLDKVLKTLSLPDFCELCNQVFQIFEVEALKKTLHKNPYPTNFVDKCISKFINNIFVQKPVVTTVPKLELRITLPFLGNISSITKKRLNRCLGKRLKFCNLQIIFQTGNRLMKYFRYKDCVPETLQSNFVYKFKCGSCTASYYGKTYRHMKVRIS